MLKVNVDIYILVISIRMFKMDKEANEVFYEGKDKTIFAGSVELFPEVEYHQLNDSQLNHFVNFFEQNEETIITEEQKTFTNWFITLLAKVALYE